MIEEKLHDYENINELISILTDIFNFLSKLVIKAMKEDKSKCRLLFTFI